MRDSAKFHGSGSEMPWSARYVEHMLSTRDFSGCQQRRDEGRCRMRESACVARSRTLPAGVLKGADGFGL